MDKKATIHQHTPNLIGISGEEATFRLADKVLDPKMALNVGTIAINRIRDISHGIRDDKGKIGGMRDGQPVVTIETQDENSLTFQFEPNERPFVETATDLDGNLLFPSSEVA